MAIHFSILRFFFAITNVEKSCQNKQLDEFSITSNRNIPAGVYVLKRDIEQILSTHATKWRIKKTKSLRSVDGIRSDQLHTTHERCGLITYKKSRLVGCLVIQNRAWSYLLWCFFREYCRSSDIRYFTLYSNQSIC